MPGYPEACAGQRVHGLDLVRFLAAGLVVLYHLGFKAWALDTGSLNPVVGIFYAFPVGYSITWCGWIGVQVFFVVSGAVIARSARNTTARTFARRRLARLLPAVLIAAVVALPIAVFLFRTTPNHAIALTLRTIVFVPWGPWIIGQFWTIPIELAFYALVWALLATRAPERAFHGLAWCLGIASAAYWAAVAGGVLSPGGRLSELLLLQHGIYFALGMLCPRLGERTLGLRHIALAMACVAAAAVQIRIVAYWEMRERGDLAVHWPWTWALWLALTASVASSFLWRNAVASRVGHCRDTLRLAGMVTYPLYLLHIHVGGAILLATAEVGVAPAVLLGLVGSTAAAVVVARWLEPPLHTGVDAILRLCGRHLPHYRGAG